MPEVPKVHVCEGIALVQKHIARGDTGWYLRVKRKEKRGGALHYKKLSPDLELSLKVAKQLEGELKAGATNKVADGQLRVSHLLWAWHKEYGPQLAPHTRKCASSNIRLHLLPAFGDLAVTALTRPRLWEYAVAKNEVRKNTEKSPAALIRNTLNTLRTACNLLWEGEIEAFADWMPPVSSEGKPLPSGRNPSKRISKTISKAEAEFGKGKREPYTKEETQILLSLAREHFPRFYPVLRLAFGTAMRIGECIGLKWENVDLASGVIHVREQITSGRHSKPKNRKSRPVVMPAGLLELMCDLRRVARPSAVYVFESANRTPLVYKTTNTWMRKLSEMAYELHGVPLGRTFHSARHTYRTRAMEEGLPKEWAERQAGHDEEAGADYVHVSPAFRPDVSFADYDLGPTGVDQSGPADRRVN